MSKKLDQDEKIFFSFSIFDKNQILLEANFKNCYHP